MSDQASLPQVFISHINGEYALASLLARWITQYYPKQIQTFVAQKDIPKGADWFETIKDKVQEADLALTVCSPTAMKEGGWLFFESGAVWGRNKPVVSVCHSGVIPQTLPYPLYGLQGLAVDSGTAFINEFFGIVEKHIPLAKRTESLDIPTMQSELAFNVNVAQNRTKSWNAFFSVPMRSVESAESFESYREGVKSVLASIEKVFGKDTYFGGRDMLDGRDSIPDPIAAFENTGALLRSQRFIMVYPERVASTCLIEIGVAVAQGLPCLLFVKRDADLPSGLRGLEQSYRNLKTYHYKDWAEIIRLMDRFGARLFFGNITG